METKEHIYISHPHTSTHTHTHAHTHAHTHMHTHTCPHTCTHTHAHTYTQVVKNNPYQCSTLKLICIKSCPYTNTSHVKVSMHQETEFLAMPTTQTPSQLVSSVRESITGPWSLSHHWHTHYLHFPVPLDNFNRIGRDLVKHLSCCHMLSHCCKSSVTAY